MRRVVIGLALAVACACEQETAPVAPPVELWDTAWRLEDLGGLGTIDNEVTLEFPEKGKAAGHGTCNRYVATVIVTGNVIRFNGIGVTRMACPEALANQEANYLKALESAESFVIEGTSLAIKTRDLPAPLLFSRATP
jgi:heat shock protein HslJ